jgi:hypothetical protein
VRLPDLFGPGKDLSTDANGARGTRAVAGGVPPGKVRVVCIGDSFTQGYGVGDDEAWPHVLEQLDPLLEVVNLGQRGYGIDQAWLWYLRKEPELEHDLVVLGFIADNWRRVRLDRYQGYPKPVLVRGEERPQIANAPLAEPVGRWGWLHLNGEVLRSARTLQLMRRVRRKLAGPAAEDPSVMDERAGADVVAQLIADLDRRCRAAGRRLVLLHLPSPDAGTEGGLLPLGAQARRVCEAAAAGGIPFVDLTSEFAALEPAEREALFLDLDEVSYPWAQNHYDPAGNRFVAAALRRRLLGLGLLPGDDAPR